MLQLELDLSPEQSDLEELLRSVAKSQDEIFQIDFISQNVTVIRQKISPRAWKKITSGAWGREDVETLIRHGLLQKNAVSSMGYEVSPRPELIGAV